ncbi:MAG: hypothetical protein ACK5XQ_01590 [Flavobacteriales bacterium]|jgi:hypothetical protein
MDARELLQKIVRSRKYLLQSGKSGRNAMRCWEAVAKVERFLSLKPTEEGARKYVLQNEMMLRDIAPGGASAEWFANSITHIANGTTTGFALPHGVAQGAYTNENAPSGGSR